MSATQLQANGLLHYNPDFKVLICRECQYAIQKSAIDSHLLKHKIYRGDRQNLLAEIAQLELLEPADVLHPSPSSPPIEALPVLQGYRCTIGGCRHLTASEKRAKRHWSEAHGVGETLPPLCEFTCSVHLQTFFRGTKVRYFEISFPVDKPVGGNEDQDGMHHAHQSEFGDDSHYNRAEIDITSASLSPLHPHEQIYLPPRSTTLQASIKVDLETLKYFHHFVTITAPTLPGSFDYWQTKVSSEALRHNGVMCGLLAISTCHLTVLSTDLPSIRFYTERQAMLSHEFSSTLHHNTRSKTKQQTPEPKNQSRAFADQIGSLLRCAQWAAAECSSGQAILELPRLEEILDAVRGCIISEPAFSLTGIQDASAQVDRSSNRQTSGHDDDSNSAGDSTFSVLLNYIQSLPLRMAETLGKPDSAEDLFATLSAIDTLVECSRISFASNDLETVWQRASEWLTKVSVRFNVMVSRHDPAAMVVLAHWAAVLVKRAEQVGCWFLQGTPKRILTLIVNQLSATNPTVLCLVDRLLSNLND